MKEWQRLNYLAKPTTAYASMFGGVEIKDVIYGCEDYVVFAVGTWLGTPSVHTAKIYYADRPYFRYRGVRVHFDELIRYGY